MLGANDGLLSTASLIIGVASAPTTHAAILIAGGAGLLAGSMSMAAGEYVSVSSQRDAEKADLVREADELKRSPEEERNELARIYVGRGLAPKLAAEVARQLTAHDPLEAHARDELGFSEAMTARPLQAAAASAISFALGAAAPLTIAALAPARMTVVAVAVGAMTFLAILGALGARAGGAPVVPAVLRVAFWGALAMVVTAAIGRTFGAAVG